MNISAAKNLISASENRKSGIIYRTLNSEERILLSDLKFGSYVYDNDFINHSIYSSDLIDLKLEFSNIIGLKLEDSNEHLLQNLKILPPLHELILIINYCVLNNRKILSCGPIFSNKIYQDLLSYFSLISESSNMFIINTYQKLLSLFSLSSQNGIITFFKY